MENDSGDCLDGVDAADEVHVPGWSPLEERDEIPDWDAPVPTAMDLVLESAAMVSGHAADQLKRIDALRLEMLADARRAGNTLTDVIERSVRLELAAALSITESAAGSLMALGEALVHRYPEVLESLSRARITQKHASDLVEAIDSVGREFRVQLLPRAISLAETLPVGTFRRKLHKLIESVRAVTLSERHERTLERRRVIAEPAEDSMGWLHWFGPMVEVHAILGRLTGTAKVLAKHPDETRTLDQLRADVLADLLIDGVTDVLPPDVRGIRPTAVVTVPALALLDCDGGIDSEPATVEGIGPIPIGRARELCGSAKGWMRVLTHPETGIVLSVGRGRYRPPPALRRLVKWRAEVCMGPGCNMPAERCQIDHNVAWEVGGQTRLDNLTPFCQGHHAVKHHGRWHVEHIDGSGGAVLWTSPSGRAYRVEPERSVPVFLSSDQGSPPF
jgi:Domain of unknown function (DUF222)